MPDVETHRSKITDCAAVPLKLNITFGARTFSERHPPSEDDVDVVNIVLLNVIGFTTLFIAPASTFIRNAPPAPPDVLLLN